MEIIGFLIQVVHMALVFFFIAGMVAFLLPNSINPTIGGILALSFGLLGAYTTYQSYSLPSQEDPC